MTFFCLHPGQPLERALLCSVATATTRHRTLHRSEPESVYSAPHSLFSSSLPRRIPQEMDFFKKSASIRLKSRHGKYLFADDDASSVYQSKNGSAKNAVWMVEFDGNERAPAVKLKSCYGCYLTASAAPFLLGMTGKKVLQTKLVDDVSSIKWQPVREGYAVKLKTTSGSFLRANAGLPPWKDTVTHDDVVHKINQESLMWEVDPVGPLIHNLGPSQKHSPQTPTSTVTDEHVVNDEEDSISGNSSAEESTSTNSIPSCSSFTKKLFPLDEPTADESPHTEANVHHDIPKRSGRVIHYAVADNEEVPDDFDLEFTFEGNDLKLLKRKLKELCGIEDDIYICAKNHVNNRLYPLLLQLPPNNLPLYVVVVRTSSKLASTLPGVGRKME